MPAMADDLLPLVPYLRRHAFLLTGSKDLGDDHVRLCLELVAAEPERLEGEDLRVALFRAFHAVNTIVETVDDQLSSLSGDYRERVRDALGLLPLPERRALLLFLVEQFSLEQTAHILDLKADAVRRVLIEARRHLEVLLAKSVLIIEDEPLIGMQLSALTTGMGFTSARLVSRMREAVAAVEKERPGLVLADVQLDGEEGGIEAAQAILRQLDVPIVFVTGHPERLSTEEGLAPAFVVKKPFTRGRLKAAIDWALATYASPASAAAHRDAMFDKLKRLTAA